MGLTLQINKSTSWKMQNKYPLCTWRDPKVSPIHNFLPTQTTPKVRWSLYSSESNQDLGWLDTSPAQRLQAPAPLGLSSNACFEIEGVEGDMSLSLFSGFLYEWFLNTHQLLTFHRGRISQRDPPPKLSNLGPHKVASIAPWPTGNK